MNEKLKKAIPYFLTGSAALALGVFTLVDYNPPWWGTLIALVVAASGILLGKPWAPPEE